MPRTKSGPSRSTTARVRLPFGSSPLSIQLDCLDVRAATNRWVHEEDRRRRRGRHRDGLHRDRPRRTASADRRAGARGPGEHARTGRGARPGAGRRPRLSLARGRARRPVGRGGARHVAQPPPRAAGAPDPRSRTSTSCARSRSGCPRPIRQGSSSSPPGADSSTRSTSTSGSTRSTSTCASSSPPAASGTSGS